VCECEREWCVCMYVRCVVINDLHVHVGAREASMKECVYVYVRERVCVCE